MELILFLRSVMASVVMNFSFISESAFDLRVDLTKGMSDRSLPVTLNSLVFMTWYSSALRRRSSSLL